MTKAVSGLGGTILLFLVISQFIAYFNYSNLPSVLAIALAEWLQSAGIGALPLLIGMIVIFPLLGHATWHAYRAVAHPEG